MRSPIALERLKRLASVSAAHARDAGVWNIKGKPCSACVCIYVSFVLLLSAVCRKAFEDQKTGNFADSTA